MKHASLFVLVAFVACGALPGTTMAAAPHAYANSISAHNIGAMQHTIMTNAIHTFEGTASAALGTRSNILMPGDKDATEQTLKKNPADEYGHLPLYGTMHLYGEYGDDGSVYGHNGGDMVSRPTINSMWLNWQHVDDNASFDNFETTDSDYDVITFGISGGDVQMGTGITDWGMFGGYVGGTQDNSAINIDENGGYVGLYGGYTLGGFNISLAADAGALYNRATHGAGTDEYANMFVGGAINATYNIALDATFTLQPGVYAGYTWVKSANYMSMDGTAIANNNLNLFEVAPGARAIKHIGSGWFGFIGAKYVFNFEHGGDATAAGARLANLESANYSEYGLGLEKSIDRFYMSIKLGRRDGGRTGWTWGTSLKYMF